FCENNQILAAILKPKDTAELAAVIDCGSDGDYDEERLQLFCSNNQIDYKLLTDIIHSDRSDVKYLRKTLDIFAENFQLVIKAEQQVDMVSAELLQTYEELMLLHTMSSNMKVTRSDSNYLQIACESLRDLVNVEGIAILCEKSVDSQKKLVLCAGSGVLAVKDENETGFELLYDRLLEVLAQNKEALLDSEIDSPFKYDWPENVANIIVVPLHSSDRVTGMMVATNRLGKPDFDSIDVKLFNSVANECAIFIENGRLFKDLGELFLGSLKALTSSIDAKDPYTRGHSERVAFISRWIAEKYAETNELGVEQMHKIYLAGLLHDIGKIGINESVLTKKGKLTEAEYDQIKKHPSIGAGILADIRQMAGIVPGVLCHHERVDGTGYPNGLKGDRIPLIGKIVMIADSFDAMTSRRTYRNAMDMQSAIDEIRDSLGTQMDEKIGRIFLNSDIGKLWRILQEEDLEKYYSNSFSKYGTVAVGVLLR
ncbi:MAG: HD domain-containing protein, partial [Planctomycetes bacterium]|nr:HD domain-containing protein [Planctomycetota bacterium]